MVAVLSSASVAGAANRSGQDTIRGGGLLGGTGLVTYVNSVAQSSNASRYSLVIVSTANAAGVSHVRGLPLVYFNGTDVPTSHNTGVPYRTASENGWLLKDANGNLLTNHSYPDYYIGDVGSTAYQQAWLRNVLAYLRVHRRLKGVFIDEVVADFKQLADSQPAKYPTQASWADAELAFVRAVGPALRAKGYYVLVNASGEVSGDPNSVSGSNTMTWWRELSPSVSGLACEYWVETADGSATLRSYGTSSWMQYWSNWQRLVRTAQSMGKDFVGLMPGPPGDVQAMAYGKASFLLDWNGRGGAFSYLPSDGSDPWNAAWTMNIGKPAAAKRQVGNGWLRRYTDGVALVNPDPSGPQTFQLGGRYTTSDGQTVTEATVPPVSGLILRSAHP